MGFGVIGAGRCNIHQQQHGSSCSDASKRVVTVYVPFFKRTLCYSLPLITSVGGSLLLCYSLPWRLWLVRLGGIRWATIRESRT